MESKIECGNFWNPSPKVVEQVRKSYDVTEKSIQRDITILRDWIKKQPHLPQDLEDNFFEKLLLFNKFRVEKAKVQIEALFTTRSMNLDLCEKLDDFRVANGSNVLYPMPKLLPTNQGIIIWRLQKWHVDDYSVSESLPNIMVLFELAIKYVYMNGYCLVIDFDGLTLGHLVKVNIIDCVKIIKLITFACSSRITSIDFINVPSYAIPFINLWKGLLRAKILSKLHVHNNLGDLSSKIPLEYLPNDIGGSGGFQKDLIRNLDKIIEDNRSLLKSVKNMRSDENKRIGEIITSFQDFGPNGTFKKINID